MLQAVARNQTIATKMLEFQNRQLSALLRKLERAMRSCELLLLCNINMLCNFQMVNVSHFVSQLYPVIS